MEKMDLYEMEDIYNACKRFVNTWEFGKECNNRKGMYVYLEGIEDDLNTQLKNIIKQLGINNCPFKEE